MNINHKFTLACDDIRQENTGKLFLIGVYSNNVILLPNIPMDIPLLSFYQQITVDSPGDIQANVRLISCNDNADAIPPMSITGKAISPGMMQGFIRIPNISIRNEGLYALKIDFGNGEIDCIELKISHQQNPPLPMAKPSTHKKVRIKK